MKEQQKRKFKQIHPEIEDGIDLRRCPLLVQGGFLAGAPIFSNKLKKGSKKGQKPMEKLIKMRHFKIHDVSYSE